MTFHVQTKSDLSGVMLVIRFPEKDLDKKALYTIQADQPDFLIPFHYRSIDGQAECTYHLGTRTLLRYQFGSRTPAEYIDFWEKILQPLLDCEDWFLTPMSFLLDTQQIYTDKNGGISYIYIPSLQHCSDLETLKVMAEELCRQNSVTDTTLENKVLRFIMQDFQPKLFLQMLRRLQPEMSHETTSHSPAIVTSRNTENARFARSGSPDLANSGGARPRDRVDHSLDQPDVEPPNDSFEENFRAIFEPESRSKKDDKKGTSPSFWERLMGKKDAPPKKQKVKKPEKRFANDGKRVIREGASEIDVQRHIQRERVGRANSAPVLLPEEVDDDETKLDCAHLRLVGAAGLPQEIEVNLQRGESFTIGRYSAKVGHQQSNFEFEKSVKAVSRRHAVIERLQDGSYAIFDLASSAGTFVGDQRLTPNVPMKLTQGCRVAFGTGGAEYTWWEVEES